MAMPAVLETEEEGKSLPSAQRFARAECPLLTPALAQPGLAEQPQLCSHSQARHLTASSTSRRFSTPFPWAPQQPVLGAQVFPNGLSWFHSKKHLKQKQTSIWRPWATLTRSLSARRQQRSLLAGA